MFPSMLKIYNPRGESRTEVKNQGKGACDRLPVLKQAGAAAVKQPNGFAHLPQGHVPGEALTAMRTH